MKNQSMSSLGLSVLLCKLFISSGIYISEINGPSKKVLILVRKIRSTSRSGSRLESLSESNATSPLLQEGPANTTPTQSR